MSLINDALRRAKEAQERAVPAVEPPLRFRPMETPAKPQRSGWMLAGILGVLMLIVGVLIWQLAQRPHSGGDVQARTATPAARVSAEPSATTTPVAAPARAEIISPAAPAQAAAPRAVAVVPEASLAQQTNATMSATNNVVVKAEPVAKPAGPKLQAIVFSPTRPSAIINGKTLFLGDKIGDQRVVAIAQDSATLAAGTATNVLFLDQ